MIFISFVCFVIFLAVWGWLAYQAPTSPNAERHLGTLQMICAEAWNFARPLLQLIIVLVIIEWFFRTRNVNISFSNLGIHWDARLLVALIVVITFCIVALSGMPNNGIKEAALVVIGFYFGSTQRRENSVAVTADSQGK